MKMRFAWGRGRDASMLSQEFGFLVVITDFFTPSTFVSPSPCLLFDNAYGRPSLFKFLSYRSLNLRFVHSVISFKSVCFRRCFVFVTLCLSLLCLCISCAPSPHTRDLKIMCSPLRTLIHFKNTEGKL